MKPFTVAAALEDGVDPNIVIPTEPGGYRIANYRITDTHYYGAVDMRRLLIKSSNIGAAKLGRQHDQPAFLFDVLQPLRLRRKDRFRLPGRILGGAVAARPLGSGREGHHLLRLWPVGDAAADRAGLRDLGQ